MPMNVSYLVDTNILVYAYDRSEHEKQKRARAILDWLESRGFGMLSTQILGEFFRIVTRKLVEPLTPRQAYVELERHLRTWSTFDITRAVALEAGRGCVAYQMPFWDAQIWATAKLNQVPQILSEDFQHGRVIEGVEFKNPFTVELPGEE
jgi:predicted nucleic acid-binding protein